MTYYLKSPYIINCLVPLNIVKPLNPSLTKVEFRTYIWDESKLEHGAGSILDKVEREDEDIVENVQKGVSSRFYKHGRYSPKMEKGIHHFHSLITKFINNNMLNNLHRNALCFELRYDLLSKGRFDPMSISILNDNSSERGWQRHSVQYIQ